MTWFSSASGRARPLAVMATGTLLVLPLAAGCGDDDEGGGTAPEGLPDSELISQIADTGEVKVGMAPAAPWLVLDPSSKEYLGPAATLSELLADKLGVEVTYVPVTFDNFVAALQSGQVDIVAAPLSVTAEREEVVTMVPWSGDGVCFLAKADGGLSTLEDLQEPGVRFGIGQGTLGESIVKSEFPDGEVVSRQLAPGEQLLYPEVESGAADVALVNGTQAQVYLEKYDDLSVIPEDCPGTVIAETPVAVAFPKGDDGMTGMVEEVIAENQSQLDEEFEEFSQADKMEQYS